ncbi:histidine phosphatase family protein [uncultured Bifidobacterium sp.]|uniref:histidine phosphatase family protein n=1 Tax=uncultured Bifidobacterium sp. TaxID=165187 RepID=UPI00260F2DE3|nr:histidine phosphatase family protein [uncultured Bifidobacterium sp.]
MIDEVVFVRHGRTSYNLSRRLQGQIDIPLDAVGRWQADMTAYALAGRYYWAKVASSVDRAGRVDNADDAGGASADRSAYGSLPPVGRSLRVVSSDLVRARQTAEALADAIHVGVRCDARLRERSFGRWEGLTREEVRELDAEAYRSWKAHSGGERAYGVEDRRDVGRRGAEAVSSLVREHADDVPTTMVLIGHGSWIVATIATLLGLSGEAISAMGAMRNGHWSVMTPTPTNGGGLRWTLEEYNRGPSTDEDWDNGPSYLRVPGAPLWRPLDATAGRA